MSDPLSLLREQFINKKPVSHDATHIFIGDLKFSRNVLTTYKQDRGEWGRGMLAADACIALCFSWLVSVFRRAGAGRSWLATGETGAAMPLRLHLPSLRLHPAIICSPHSRCPPPPMPACVCVAAVAIQHEQAVAIRIRSRRFTICCRNRTLLVRPRRVRIMMSAR
jgi:hypothetical protein